VAGRGRFFGQTPEQLLSPTTWACITAEENLQGRSELDDALFGVTDSITGCATAVVSSWSVCSSSRFIFISAPRNWKLFRRVARGPRRFIWFGRSRRASARSGSCPRSRRSWCFLVPLVGIRALMMMGNWGTARVSFRAESPEKSVPLRASTCINHRVYQPALLQTTATHAFAPTLKGPRVTGSEHPRRVRTRSAGVR